MLKNYLKIGLRTMRRHAGYTLINLSGLAVGLACSFFILLWVQDELSVDRFFSEGERVHQVLRNVNVGEQVFTWSATAKPLGDVLRSEYPEISDVVQTIAPGDFVVASGDESFRESGFFAGSAFFEVFDFPFLAGDPRTALQGEDGLVITDRTARKLFGSAWPSRGGVLGRTITIDQQRVFTVTGVVADLPDNTTFRFDVVLPIQDFYARNEWVDAWGANGFRTYVKLKEEAAPAIVSEKIAGIVNANEEGAEEVLFLQPFEDVYLHSEYVDGELVGGRIETVRIFSLVVVFLLLIAAINFMNLATARSAKRAPEIGVRKSMGAERRSLVRQFLGESVLLAMMAYVLAVALVALLMPVFAAITGKQLSLSDLSAGFLLGGLAVSLAVGLLAGSYPALYLSSISPLAALRGSANPRGGSAFVRKGLVVFQFALSTLFIVATATIYLQIQYIQSRDVGLDRNDLLYVNQEGSLQTQYHAVRQELLAEPAIQNVTRASTNPLDVGRSTGSADWDGRAPEQEYETYLINADFEFIETMRMELVAGRTFSPQFGADSANYVINEKMAGIMGPGAVNKQLSIFGEEGTVVGVVRDFDMNSLYEPDEPLVIRLQPAFTSRIYVRAAPGRTAEAIASIQRVAKEINPAFPLDIHFLNDEYEAAYRNEVIVGRLASIFAGIAIFVSCLGLFGLISYTAEQRTKEIGVRKVLGASVSRVILLLTKDQLKLVVAGIAIATPIAYYAATSWLQNFEHHVNASVGLFITAGMAAILIAGLTVSLQAARAALVNPVKSLRSE